MPGPSLQCPNQQIEILHHKGCQGSPKGKFREIRHHGREGPQRVHTIQIELEKGKAKVPQAEIVARKIAPLLPQPRLQGETWRVQRKSVKLRKPRLRSVQRMKSDRR